MPPIFNTALKLAIFESRKKQKRIAKLARIAETQLSHIVRGRRPATAKEQARLATVLKKSVNELFPETLMRAEPYTTAPESSVRLHTDEALS